jgi:hypothetical protein
MAKSKLFAQVRGDELLLKLPADRVRDLVARRSAGAFKPRPGRAMTEWVLVDLDARRAWNGPARKALGFAQAKR